LRKSSKGADSGLFIRAVGTLLHSSSPGLRHWSSTSSSNFSLRWAAAGPSASSGIHPWREKKSLPVSRRASTAACSVRSSIKRKSDASLGPHSTEVRLISEVMVSILAENSSVFFPRKGSDSSGRISPQKSGSLQGRAFHFARTEKTVSSQFPGTRRASTPRESLPGRK